MSTPTTPSTSLRRALLSAAAAFLLSAIPVVLASVLLFQQERAARQEETRMLAEQAALRLTDFVRARFLALEIVRLEAESPTFVPDERFDFVAAATEAQYHGFQAINWIDSDGIIRRVVPREPNLPALDRDLLAHEPTRDALRSAFTDREPRATGPIDLLQGGRGFATYFPVERGSTLVGAINGVFRVDDLVEGCLGDALLAHYVVVIDDEERPVYGDDESLDSAGAATETLPLLGREWRLRLTPRAAAEPAHVALDSFVVVGLAFAVALAAFAFLTVRRQQTRLLAEQEQRRLEQQLARAQRLEGLGRLAGGVAHDFNNLLAVILASNEHVARSAGALPAAVRESLEDARMAADRAAGLTRQLLAFSREQPRVAGRLELRETVRTTERMLRRLVREDVELTAHYPDEPVWVVSDAAQLTQVIVNLVMNASDALAGPGHIDVTVIRREGTGPREPAGVWAVLEVKDDGPGIAKAHLEHIYEPFYTTKGEHEGTGLGLATVYGVLQQHGGHVTVDSMPGAGATFRAFFPLAPAEAPKEEAPLAEVAPSPREDGDVVLLVEDEELLRRTVSRALTAGGRRVIEATDGVDALEKLDGDVVPDIVVTDFVMPKMGGLELIRAMRERGLKTPVVLLSGHVNVDVTHEELEALGAHFMSKPYTAPQLVAAMDETLEKHGRKPATA